MKVKVDHTVAFMKIDKAFLSDVPFFQKIIVVPFLFIVIMNIIAEFYIEGLGLKQVKAETDYNFVLLLLAHILFLPYVLYCSAKFLFGFVINPIFSVLLPYNKERSLKNTRRTAEELIARDEFERWLEKQILRLEIEAIEHPEDPCITNKLTAVKAVRHENAQRIIVLSERARVNPVKSFGSAPVQKKWDAMRASLSATGEESI